MGRIGIRYVHGFIDHHGRPRFYFRRGGFKRVPLPGLPGSTEFMEAYRFALSGEADPIELGASRTKPGTVNAAIVSFYNNSADFQGWAAETKRTRRNILERFRIKHGDHPVALLQRKHVERMVAEKAGTPPAARNFLITLRALMKHCIAMEMRADDPTTGVKSPKIVTDGFETWTEDDIAAFESHHAIGARARLALALLLYTGQRRGDIVKMGRQHIRDGLLQVRQHKTGYRLQIPFTRSSSISLTGPMPAI